MSKIRLYLYIVIGAIALFLVGYLGYLSKELKECRAKYDVEFANNRILEAENSQMTDDIEVLRYSMKDIKASNDSLVREMYLLSKKLKAKDKDIKQLQYMLSTAERTDSIILKDTILVSERTQIDTIIGDKWMSTRVQLKYPSFIGVTPHVKSERMVLMSEQKKIIGIPSKIFFIRWFQKKYTTVEVDIIENNPYIESDINKFIEVVK